MNLSKSVAVLGTGGVAQTLVPALTAAGFTITLGTRNPEEAGARPEVAALLQAHPGLSLKTYAEAAAGAGWALNAVSGQGSLAALAPCAAALAGKVLVDLSNPLDFSTGSLRLSVCNGDSLAEQIQRVLPDTKVVKTLNTITASLMLNPRALAEGAHTMFLSGDDAEAKAAVRAWLEGFGWRDLIDLGNLTKARAQEMYLPLWIDLWGVTGHAQFSVQVVR